jgi:hypothetical protein
MGLSKKFLLRLGHGPWHTIVAFVDVLRNDDDSNLVVSFPCILVCECVRLHPCSPDYERSQDVVGAFRVV